jgi:hypothetical protein
MKSNCFCVVLRSKLNVECKRRERVKGREEKRKEERKRDEKRC